MFNYGAEKNMSEKKIKKSTDRQFSIQFTMSFHNLFNFNHVLNRSFVYFLENVD